MMRKTLFALAVCLGLGACEVRMSDNGDFDGLWQLSAIDSTRSGQVHLLEVRNSKGGHSSVLFRFDLTGDSLKLRSPYYDESGEGGDNIKELEEVTAKHAQAVKSLKPYGIDVPTQGYRLVTLDSDEMILQKDDVKLCFRKY